MSIILKALKKAEELKTRKENRPEVQVFLSKGKRAWVILFALLLIAALVFLVVRSMPVSKQATKAMNTTQSVQQKDARQDTTAVVEKIDTDKLHEDAIKLIGEKNYSGAEAILRKALLIKPDDAAMNNNLGLTLKNQGRYKEASLAYEKAIQLKPDFYEAMNNLAVTCEMLGDREKAKNLYKKALSIKPSYAEAHLNYALLLEAIGNNSEAESHYHTFLNLSSDEGLKSKVRERLRGLKK